MNFNRKYSLLISIQEDDVKKVTISLSLRIAILTPSFIHNSGGDWRVKDNNTESKGYVSARG